MKRLAPAFLIVIALSAAGSTCRPYVPRAELAEARQAVVDAQYVETLKFCPQLLKEAQKHLRAAEEAMAKKDYNTALAESNKAHRLAEDIKRCRENYTNPVFER